MNKEEPITIKLLLLSSASNVHTLRWANSLSGRGIDVHLVYNKGDGSLKNEFEGRISQYELPFSGTSGYYLNALFLKKLIKKIEPDLLHAHYISGYGTLARLTGFDKIIMSVWGSDVFIFPNRNKFGPAILRKNLGAARLICSTSRVMAEETAKYTSKKIEVIAFGVDESLFNPESYDYNRDEDQINIGFIKSLKRIYGVDLLIQAFSRLTRRLEEEGFYGTLSLHIYGEGPLEEELKVMAKSLGQESVFFHGRIDNSQVPEALSKLDIFASPSLSESFGVSALEAMAMGLPVVLSSAPGFIEITQEGSYGKIVTIGDVEELSQGLYELVLDKKLREDYGRKARANVLEHYRWQDNVEEMVSLYRKLL